MLRTSRHRCPPPTAPGHRTKRSRHRRAAWFRRAAPLGFGADNDVADPGAPGIVFGRQYHCYGHTVTPPQLAEIGQLPGSGGMKQLAERRLQQGQHGLGLRIAESAVELDHRRPAGGNRETNIQQSAKRASTPD